MGLHSYQARVCEVIRHCLGDSDMASLHDVSPDAWWYCKKIYSVCSVLEDGHFCNFDQYSQMILS